MNFCIVDIWRSNTATNMWHIYISFAVLFRGTYCIPLKTTAEHSSCTVVIKRLGEEVKTLEVKWNSTIHLICDASCVGPRPQLSLTWFYKDKNRSKLINIEKLFSSPKFETYPKRFHRKNELVIRDFGPNEETDFICKGSNKKQRLEAMVALIGTGGPVINGGETRIDTQIVNVGDRVEMECIVAGTPLPTIRWSRDDGPLPATAIRGDGILIIPDARLEDAGTYTCTAINQAGSVQSKVVLYVKARPLISVPQSSMTAALGDSASIGCEASGYPNPQITWQRKNGQMPSEYTIVDGNLKIPRVKIEDAGTYICSAKNQYGQSDASVDLKIGGTPLPTIRWSRDDGPLPATAIRGDGILIFPDARLEDAGTYTCTAINQAGSVQSKVVLYVGVRPLISVPQSSMTASLGESALIGCEASGYPNPQITWYRKNGQMPSEYTIVDGNLKIPRVKTEDAGTYICSAKNQYGQSDASVDLKIEEKEKTIMVSTGINGDGDNGLFSTTDGVTDNTGEFTDTTPFDYEFYAN